MGHIICEYMTIYDNSKLNAHKHIYIYEYTSTLECTLNVIIYEYMLLYEYIYKF